MIGWKRISPLTPRFLTASGCSDLPIIHRWPHYYIHCQYTALHWTAPPCAADEPSLSPLNSSAGPHSQRHTGRELEKERVQSNSEQVVRGQRSCAIGTAAPLLAARAELWEGPGSRYDDLLYRGPQNIPSYQNDLSAGAWEGEQSPSIILKINPPLYSSPESINNVGRGENLRQRFILILWLLFISL